MATRKKIKKNENEVFNALIAMQKAAQKLNLPAKAKAKRGGASATAVDVCATYAKIKPVLKLIANFPLLPKKIKDAVTMLMSVLDTICPSA